MRFTDTFLKFEKFQIVQALLTLAIVFSLAFAIFTTMLAKSTYKYERTKAILPGAAAAILYIIALISCYYWWQHWKRKPANFLQTAVEANIASTLLKNLI